MMDTILPYLSGVTSSWGIYLMSLLVIYPTYLIVIIGISGIAFEASLILNSTR